ncbi:MAG: hypothetical protein OXR67_12115 [Chloroflexota bacterium]|nr:hypothetical protein [Chloroflexota bacterium]
MLVPHPIYDGLMAGNAIADANVTSEAQSAAPEREGVDAMITNAATAGAAGTGRPPTMEGCITGPSRALKATLGG